MGRPVRRTTESFIAEAKLIHGDKFDYSKCEYTKAHSKITLICPVHGEFQQRASNHLQGQGCKECTTDISRKSIDEFISEANEVHSNKYDYSLVEFTSIHQKVRIQCDVHGVFEQEVAKHLSGQGCKRCKGREVWTTDDFVTKAKEIHGDSFNYDQVIFKRNNEKVLIVCNECGSDFLQVPMSHLVGNGCPFCAGNIAISESETRERISKAHFDEIQMIGEYNGADSPTLFKHTCGHQWTTIPSKIYYRRQGCPACKTSLGNQYIYNYLKMKKITFESERRFDSCRDKNTLPFDFYIPERRLLIEFDGAQHFQVVQHFGGEKAFEDRQRKDKIKDQWARDNDMKLIRIRYDEDLEESLDSIFES